MVMEPIDRPFRFSWDFCVVWGLLTLPIYFLTRDWDLGPWYSYAAFMIVGTLLATFVIYGPVLLMRQMIRSGPRGHQVVRAFLTTLLLLTLFFVALYIFSGGKHISSIWGGVAAIVACTYLRQNLKR